MVQLSTAFTALLSAVALSAVSAQSGTGKTTRYWDCCKPSCGWAKKASVNQPVLSCDANQNKLYNFDIKSGCDGGTAYTCADNQPWVVSSDLAYGFAAVKLNGQTEATWCCECYELTFTSGPVAGKRMIVQATNTGGDLGDNHFDILMPGGGVGLFNACPAQYGSWNGGAQYGGVSSRAECDNLPSQVRTGCYWRFDWFQNADNPNVSWKKTYCPDELVAKTGCRRNDSGPPPTSTTTTTRSSTSTTSTTSTRTTSTTTSRTTSTTTTRTTSTTTTRPSSTTTTTTSTPGNGGGTVQKWGQCGGLNYTGPTTCVSGTTCTKLNDWYYQCL